jgi:hypothetical protein
MRGLPVLALALLLAGSAAGSSAGSPISLGSFAELSGFVALGGGSSGQRLRFLPNRKFSVGIVVDNDSHTAIVITRADVLEPPRTLIHQTGARFVPFDGSPCTDSGSCPAPTFRIGSGIAHRPHPFTIRPGKEMGVELDFRLGSCADVATASPAPVSRLRVTFHLGGGSTRTTVLPLGYEALRLRMPKPEDCTFPRSQLFVNDPTSLGTSYLFTVPGSKGDVCTRTGTALTFRSRALENNERRPERIEIHFRDFAGKGTYRRAVASIVTDRRTAFKSTAIVTVTKATSTEVFGQVHAERLRLQANTGPFRIYGWIRCRVAGG